MPNNNSVGTCVPLCVGTMDLVFSLISMAMYIYAVSQICCLSLQPTFLVAIVAVRGALIGLAVLLAILLICSGCAIESLTTCRGICFAWITFRLLLVLSAIVALIYQQWWRDTSTLVVGIVSLLLWLAVLAAVVNHTFNLSGAIHVMEIQEFKQRMQMPQMACNKIAQQAQENMPEVACNQPPMALSKPERAGSIFPPLPSYNQQQARQAWNIGTQEV